MPGQDWSRSRKSGRKDSDAKSIPIGLVVQFYGGEVKEGRASSVRCVMHDDSRKSAVINTYENLYFCHTCGKGGSSVAIVMEKENLEFKDAVKRAVEIVTGSGHTLQSKHRRGNAGLSRRTWNI